MLEISTQEMKRVTLITVKGRINSDTVSQLEDTLNGLLERGDTRLVVELSGVSFISSAGLRALLAALKTARKNGGDVRLAAPSAEVTEVLELAGLVSVFERFEDQITAVGSF